MNMGLHGVSIWMALVTGFCLAALYDCFRILRITVSGRPRQNGIFDFLFMLFCGVITYLVAIGVDFGRVRFFLLASEVIGACVYFLTIGAVTVRAAKLLHKVYLCLRKLVFRVFVRPARFTMRIIGRLFLSIVKKVRTFLEKTAKKRKYPLKRNRGVVYNQNVDVCRNRVVLQRGKRTKGEKKDEGNRRKKEKK